MMSDENVNFSHFGPFLATLGHFWPVFDLIWLWYQFPKFSRSIFELVLTGLSDIGKKNSE